jgi:hypothetical protein
MSVSGCQPEARHVRHVVFPRGSAVDGTNIMVRSGPGPVLLAGSGAGITGRSRSGFVTARAGAWRILAELANRLTRNSELTQKPERALHSGSSQINSSPELHVLVLCRLIAKCALDGESHQPTGCHPIRENPTCLLPSSRSGILGDKQGQTRPLPKNASLLGANACCSPSKTDVWA